MIIYIRLQHISHFNLLLLLLFATVFFSCQGDNEEDYYLGSSGGDAPNGVVADVMKYLELPQPQEGNDLLVHRTKVNGNEIVNYTIEYDRTAYHSRWVAFRFDAQTRPKKVGRKDYGIRPQYPHDPLLPATVGLADDVSFNGYDHGHLVASADRLFSREGNDQTFYMTNMSPMIGNFNSKYWVALEQLVQDKGRDATFSDTLYVVKGGTIRSDQVLQRVASGRIVVPKYYFMALLKVKNGNYSSIGFWVEHKNYGSNYAARSEMKQHVVSIDRLEELTDIDFFHNLPDVVEIPVEQNTYATAWGL